MKTVQWTSAGLLIAATLAAGPAWAAGGLLRFEVNPEQSKVSASVAEPMAMIRGNAGGAFRITSGEVEGNPSQVGDTARVKVVIDAASYKTDSEGRDQDVKENALEVQKFPTITFESTGLASAQQNGDTNANLSLVGRLTLHGVTKDITVPVAVRLEEGRLVADGSYAFKFEEYGVKRPSKMMGLMTTGDVATIEFHVVADPA
ncbi:MAG: YceI family protein [Deltaproteobacteria bacterium]|nr:YceI family protein [Deltaproteobacteria bacterium]